ncbi:nuclear transport factor 2 family protein [Flavobacterium sp. LB2R40]|uniref:nuclear transport factor 2 family protein n=1 Tax=unclassified Flavobacterium TaxID=196869 RepID=UPI003AAF3383
MTSNENTLIQFYTAFANGDATTMCACYHPIIQFRDPAFGLLEGNDVNQMWKMLLKKSKGNIKIEFSNIKADEYIGSARWVATYNFSKTNRKVINIIQSQFHFKDGLIIKHTDDFDIWKWSKQALGMTGFLFGWTGYFQHKIQQQAILSLNAFKETKHADLNIKNTL